MLSHLRPLVLVPFIALLGCDSDDPGSDASVETDALVMDAGPVSDGSLDTDALVIDAAPDSDGSVNMDPCVVTAEVRGADGALQAYTRLTYDGHRVTTAEYDDDADAEHVHSYTYDEAGNVSTVVYDDAGEDEDILLSHVYDVDGALTRVDVSGLERTVGFDYVYEDGQLRSVSADPGTIRLALAYEPRDQVSICGIAYGIGVPVRYSTYGYDSEGNRLTRDSFYSSAEESTALSRSTMTYDSEGNPLTEDVHNIEYAFGRTIEVRELLVRRSWTHDAAGNVLTGETDSDGDGTVDQRTTWAYECGSLPAPALPVPRRIMPLSFTSEYLENLCPR